MENLYTPNCIRTFTGKYFNILEPTEDMIDIVDIAHSLSNQCRFAGHLPNFYSVAQHSFYCGAAASPPNKLAALLHDASEAYLVDVPKPVKRELTNYDKIEDSIMQLIAKKFGFKYPFDEEIKKIDKSMLEREWDILMLGRKDEYRDITCWDPKEARQAFLDCFYSICNK